MVTKKKAVKKDIMEDFNFDDWISAAPAKYITNRRNGFDENVIRVKIKKHQKKENIYHFGFSFRKKILSIMDKKYPTKIIVLKHRNYTDRFLLTRSENGYAVAQPQKDKDYYYFKALIFSDIELPEGYVDLNPVIHPKGASSGSIIELRLTNEETGRNI